MGTPTNTHRRRLCMNRAQRGGIALLIVMSLVPQGSASGSAARSGAARLEIPRVVRVPSLDSLVARVSASGSALADFRQREPGDGIPSSLPTAASVFYDEDNLYVLFVCKDERRKIRAHLAKREDISGDDQVVVYVDTFGDRRRAYLFASNPLGVQLDGTITEGQDEDDSFDTLWYSEGKLTKDGYAVLMTIPFRSLRFSNAASQTWGMALGRVIPCNNGESYWPYITKRVEGFVPQFASANGLEGISPGRNVQFIPYAVSTRSRFLDMDPPVPGFTSQSELRGGLDTKLVLHDAFALDVALNPDFSQVESDEPQVTINQRFEVVFPERRPFFVENAGFFGTPTELFFSRRIADPQYGLRLTGKANRWVVGGLAMDDRAPGRVVAPSDPLRGDRAVNGILSVRREIGDQSSLGILGTSRDFGSGSNRVFSLDSRLKLTPTWVLSAQAMRAFTRFLDGRRLEGPGYLLDLTRDGKSFDYQGTYTDLSPEFRAQLGHVKRVDIRQLEQTVEYRWRPEHSPLVKFGPTLETLYNADHTGLVQDWEVGGYFKLDFTGNTKVEVGRYALFERFEGTGFRKHSTTFEFDTEWLKWLAASATYTRGTEINFDPAPGLEPFLANAQEADLTLTLRPSPRLSLDQTAIYSGLTRRSGYPPPSASGSTRIFENPIARWKLNYQFTRALSLRFIVDYQSVLPNTALVKLEREKHLAGDLLATYLLNPGTALYLGYTDRRENLALDAITPPRLRRTDDLSTSTGRQFFVKVSYLVRR